MAAADKDKKPATPEGEAAPAGKKKPPLKVIIIVAGLMAAEAGGVYLFVGMTGPKTQIASAEVQGADQKADHEFIELQLVDEKFQNLQTGNVWVWDIAIYLKVKAKYEGYVSEVLEKRQAELKEGVAQIVRRAQHSHLRETDLTTLNRQLTAYLNTVIEPDTATGASRIERVLIPKCKGLQLD
jgi:flagellar basal body-associated protein FliL